MSRKFSARVVIMLKYGTIILHSNVLIPFLLCEYINHKPTSKMVCYQLYQILRFIEYIACFGIEDQAKYVKIVQK